MRVYLAGLESKLHNKSIIEQIYSNSGTISILGSFFNIRRRNTGSYSLLFPYFKDFLLDSGAFSFMNSQCNVHDWNKYLEEYADYIKKNQVEKFFELDIDMIVGYDKVKEYRSILERIVNRPCIPVWHRSRGQDEFLRLCDEYSYVAIGGIAIKHISQNEYKNFTYLIRESHRRSCKIHGLGFTSFSGLRKYHFDSVDSTSWLGGSRFGQLYKFANGQLRRISHKDNTRAVDTLGLDSFNFGEWVKFQKYAEVHL